jgi:hypothetical protein
LVRRSSSIRSTVDRCINEEAKATVSRCAGNVLLRDDNEPRGSHAAAQRSRVCPTAEEPIPRRVRTRPIPGGAGDAWAVCARSAPRPASWSGRRRGFTSGTRSKGGADERTPSRLRSGRGGRGHGVAVRSAVASIAGSAAGSAARQRPVRPLRRRAPDWGDRLVSVVIGRGSRSHRPPCPKMSKVLAYPLAVGRRLRGRVGSVEEQPHGEARPGVVDAGNSRSARRTELVGARRVIVTGPIRKRRSRLVPTVWPC